MAIVRRASRLDIPQIVEMGVAFAEASKVAHQFEVSVENIILFANEVLESSMWVKLVLEQEGVLVGMIGGVLTPIFFSKDIALQELVWYVKNGVNGLPLLRAFENEANVLGATQIVIGDKPGYVDMQKIYSRLGYRLLERQYVKKVK